ncbi:MAG: MFS transporter [Xanthomonadaceae bacterium]|nr:MFS transporter [Xanthomonadaceae bacterium]
MAIKWWVLTAVACGTFMATLDSSIVTIALPTLTKEFSTDLVHVKWVVVSHLLTITCFLLPMGRISDLYGRKRVFTLGFGLFIFSSVLCGLSPRLWSLIISRILQGVGAAMLMSNGPALITAAFPRSELGKALGTMAMVTSAGLISGPSIGGMLVQHIGWRMIFILNLPVGIAGIYLVLKYVNKDPIPNHRIKFDWIGAILQFIGINTFLTVFDPQILPSQGFDILSPVRISLAFISILCLVLFIVFESKSSHPLVDLSLLKIKSFWTGNLAAFFIFVAFSSISVLMPFYLEEVLHFESSVVGLLMTAIPLTVFVIAPISGRLSDRYGAFGLSFLGTLIGATGLLMMSGYVWGDGIQNSITQPGIVIALGSIGLATALFQPPNNTSIMMSVPIEKLGSAAATIATVRNLGLVTGAGFSTDIFLLKYQTTNNFLEALHLTHFMSGLIALCALMATFGKIGQITHKSR